MSGSVNPGLKELTVSCNQCGSANLVRLDRREYRCNHCGAITVVSDDDEERFRAFLRDALSNGGKAAAAHTPKPATHRQVIVLSLFALCLLAILLTVLRNELTAVPGNSASTKANVPQPQHGIGTADSGNPANGDAGASRPGSAGGQPAFDTRLLVAQAPRHLLDEKGRNIYIGEVTNTSPNLVAVAPEVTMVLFRSGREVEHASRTYPDLVPGVHVPVFFHYDDGAAAPFDEMRLLWEPTKAYRLGGTGYARLTTEVASDLVPRGHGRRTTIEVTGRVRNVGDAGSGASVYAVLRDAQGMITGYAHGDIPGIAPGEFDNVRFVVYVNGAPAVRAELSALPQSSAER